jgi:hypothetical protein
VLGAADESVTVSLIWLAAFTVLFFGAAVRFYRRDQANRCG